MPFELTYDDKLAEAMASVNIAVVQAGKSLQELYDSFEEHNCRCFISPPCTHCTECPGSNCICEDFSAECSTHYCTICLACGDYHSVFEETCPRTVAVGFGLNQQRLIDVFRKTRGTDAERLSAISKLIAKDVSDGLADPAMRELVRDKYEMSTPSE